MTAPSPAHQPGTTTGATVDEPVIADSIKGLADTLHPHMHVECDYLDAEVLAVVVLSSDWLKNHVAAQASAALAPATVDERPDFATLMGEHASIGSDERKIGDEWVWGFDCECGEFVPDAEVNQHLADAINGAINGWLGDVCERATERAYFQIAVEKCLTVQWLGDSRAAVPGHWRAEAESRAAVPVADILAALTAPTAEGSGR